LLINQQGLDVDFARHRFAVTPDRDSGQSRNWVDYLDSGRILIMSDKSSICLLSSRWHRGGAEY
jgi:hypothetical protein